MSVWNNAHLTVTVISVSLSTIVFVLLGTRVRLWLQILFAMLIGSFVAVAITNVTPLGFIEDWHKAAALGGSIALVTSATMNCISAILWRNRPGQVNRP